MLSSLEQAIEDLGLTTQSRVESYAKAILAIEGALGLIEDPPMFMTLTLEKLRAEAGNVSSEIDRHGPNADVSWQTSVVQTLRRRSAEGIQQSGTILLRNGGAGPDPATVSALLSADG